MQLSWLKRVTEGHAECKKRRESGAPKVASESGDEHRLRPELVPSADFRCQVGLPTDALELLGEEIRHQQRRFQRERVVNTHPEQPMGVSLNVTGKDLLRHNVRLRLWRTAKE